MFGKQTCRLQRRVGPHTQGSICVYVHIHIYVYIHTYIHIYIYIHTHTYICICLDVYTHVYMRPMVEVSGTPTEMAWDLGDRNLKSCAYMA